LGIGQGGCHELIEQIETADLFFAQGPHGLFAKLDDQPLGPFGLGGQLSEQTDGLVHGRLDACAQKLPDVLARRLPRQQFRQTGHALTEGILHALQLRQDLFEGRIVDVASGGIQPPGTVFDGGAFPDRKFRPVEHALHGVGQKLAVGALELFQLPVQFAGVADAGFVPLLGQVETFVIAGDPVLPGRGEITPYAFFLGGFGQLVIFLPRLVITVTQGGDVFELTEAVFWGEVGHKQGALGHPDGFAGDFDVHQIADGGQVGRRYGGQLRGNRGQSPKAHQTHAQRQGCANEESADKFHPEFEIAHERPPW